MKSCLNCLLLSHIKQTTRFGEEPVCSFPPTNFNEDNYRYENIAEICDKYKTTKTI